MRGSHQDYFQVVLHALPSADRSRKPALRRYARIRAQRRQTPPRVLSRHESSSRMQQPADNLMVTAARQAGTVILRHV
jgi:hypothetical protein